MALFRCGSGAADSFISDNEMMAVFGSPKKECDIVSYTDGTPITYGSAYDAPYTALFNVKNKSTVTTQTFSSTACSMFGIDSANNITTLTQPGGTSAVTVDISAYDYIVISDGSAKNRSITIA